MRLKRGKRIRTIYGGIKSHFNQRLYIFTLDYKRTFKIRRELQRQKLREAVIWRYFENKNLKEEITRPNFFSNLSIKEKKLFDDQEDFEEAVKRSIVDDYLGLQTSQKKKAYLLKNEKRIKNIFGSVIEFEKFIAIHEEIMIRTIGLEAWTEITIRAIGI